MTTTPAKYRTGRHPGGRRYWIIFCPGCEQLHQISDLWTVTEHDDGTLTADPSILVTGGPDDTRCHSYLRAGTWEFLSDSTHDHAGTNHPMPDLPPYLQ